MARAAFNCGITIFMSIGRWRISGIKRAVSIRPKSFKHPEQHTHARTRSQNAFRRDFVLLFTRKQTEVLRGGGSWGSTHFSVASLGAACCPKKSV